MTRDEVNYILDQVKTNGVVDKSKILLIEFDNNGTLTADRSNPDSFDFIEIPNSTEGGIVKLRYLESGFSADTKTDNGKAVRVRVEVPTVIYRSYDMIQVIHIKDPNGKMTDYSANKLVLQG